MRVYDSFGPNPRALRMFLLEKKIELPSQAVDLMAGENRAAPYTTKNPGGQVPALELDDGRVLGETVAIFEYLEEKNPKPPLIGATAEERAETRMWTRRVELNITEHLYNGFRFAEGLELFKTRIPVIPEAAAGLKATVQKRLAWLDGLLKGRKHIVGDRFTIADIVLYCALDFGASVGQPIDPACGRVTRWMAGVAERPSAKGSLHPMADAIGMKG
jgi:glutathione S-transferase